MLLRLLCAQELKAQNARAVEFLAKPESVQELVRHLVVPPTPDTEQGKAQSLPLAACEVRRFLALALSTQTPQTTACKARCRILEYAAQHIRPQCTKCTQLKSFDKYCTVYATARPETLQCCLLLSRAKCIAAADGNVKCAALRGNQCLLLPPPPLTTSIVCFVSY